MHASDPSPQVALARLSRSRSASALVAIGILLSRLAGLIRESVFSAFLGIGAASDALSIAIRLPNVMQMLLGEGTLSASFIPVYSAEVERDEEEAGRIAGAIAALLAVVTFAIVLIAVILARPIAWVVAAGIRDEPHFDLAVTLIRITFPSAGILVLSAWCLGILNSHRRFFLSYVAPVLWNIAQIAAITIAALVLGIGDGDLTVIAEGAELSDAQKRELAQENVDVLGGLATAAAIGFFVGSCLQFLIQTPLVFRLAKGLRFRLDTTITGVRTVISRFWGAVLSRGVVQISALVDSFIALLLVTGAVTALFKAQLLYILPVSIFAVSIASTELPEMSKMTVRDDIRLRAVAGYQRILFFVSFSALTYVLLGDRVVGTLFERGAWGSDETLQTWMVLGAYALGLPAAAVSRLTQNAVWSRGDTVGPARIATVRLVVAVVVALATMFAFDQIGPSDIREALPTIDGSPGNDTLRMGAMGITFGSAIASWVEAVLLGRLADRHIPGMRPLAALPRLVPALAAAGLVAILGRIITQDMVRPVALVIAGGASGLTYLAVCRITNISEVNLFLKGPLRRLRVR